MRQHSAAHISSPSRNWKLKTSSDGRESNRSRLHASPNDRSIDLAKPRSIQFTLSGFAWWLILDTAGALTVCVWRETTAVGGAVCIGSQSVNVSTCRLKSAAIERSTESPRVVYVSEKLRSGIIVNPYLSFKIEQWLFAWKRPVQFSEFRERLRGSGTVKCPYCR